MLKALPVQSKISQEENCLRCGVKYDPDLLEPTKMNELRSQSMICFAGSGFVDYANAKNKADFFSYAKGKFFPLPQRIFSLGLSSGEILVYAYLLYREDRKTFKCHPSYETIGKAVGEVKEFFSESA